MVAVAYSCNNTFTSHLMRMPFGFHSALDLLAGVSAHDLYAVGAWTANLSDGPYHDTCCYLFHAVIPDNYTGRLLLILHVLLMPLCMMH